MIACACGNVWINERMASWTWMCFHVTGRANGPWNDSGGVAWATTTITSGITNRMSSGNPVGDVECNVGGCSCAGGCCWCSFLLIQSSQCWKQPSCQWTIKPFIHVSMLSFLSLVPSLSLSHTTHSYNSIYTLVHNAAFQPVLHGTHATQPHSFHGPFTHPVTCKHVHIQLAIYSFIQSLPQAHAIMPLH